MVDKTCYESVSVVSLCESLFKLYAWMRRNRHAMSQQLISTSVRVLIGLVARGDYLINNTLASLVDQTNSPKADSMQLLDTNSSNAHELSSLARPLNLCHVVQLFSPSCTFCFDFVSATIGHGSNNLPHSFKQTGILTNG